MAKKILIALGYLLAAILILTLLTPTGSAGSKKGEGIRLQNKSAIKGLEIALNGYQTEYRHLPQSLQSLVDDKTLVRSEGPLIKSLVAKDPIDNPDKIMFFEPSTQKKKSPGILPDQSPARIVDSWGEMYYILADTDNDGQILNPEPGTELPQISTRVLIYSSGPDKNPNTWKDNIKSWD